MDWQGIGVVITAIGVIVTAFLQFYQYGKNKEIDYKIAKREQEDKDARANEARKNKDWAEADRIRDELTAKGVKILDTPEGAKWSL